MGKTKVTCSGCGHDFKPGKMSETVLGGLGGGAGGIVGSGAGLAILGTAYAATAPLAIAGTAAGVAAGSVMTKCSHCDKIQWK